MKNPYQVYKSQSKRPTPSRPPPYPQAFAGKVATVELHDVQPLNIPLTLQFVNRSTTRSYNSCHT